MNKFFTLPENRIRYQITSLVVGIILSLLLNGRYTENIKYIVPIFLFTLLAYRLAIYSFINNSFRKKEYKEFFVSKKSVIIEIIYTLIVSSFIIYYLITSTDINLNNNDDLKAVIIVLSLFVIMTINVIIALKITKKYILKNERMSDTTKGASMYFLSFLIALIGTIIMSIALVVILGSLGVRIV